MIKGSSVFSSFSAIQMNPLILDASISGQKYQTKEEKASG